MAVGIPGARAILRCSTAPAATFATDGVTCRAAVPTEHHPRDARTFGDAQERTDVLGVGDAVEDQNERGTRRACGTEGLTDLVQRGLLQRRCERDDSLR